jgi:hypothetical protein
MGGMGLDCAGIIISGQGGSPPGRTNIGGISVYEIQNAPQHLSLMQSDPTPSPCPYIIIIYIYIERYRGRERKLRGLCGTWMQT